MEEDIKILEEFIQEPQAEYEEVYLDGKLISKLERLPIEFKPNKKVAQAIENLLARNKELEEENKRYRESDYETTCMENNHLQEQMDKLNDYCIPISVIQNKINGYLEYDKIYKTHTSDGRENFTMEYFKAQTLKELLEERNK